MATMRKILGATRTGVGKSQGYLGLDIKDDIIMDGDKTLPVMVTAWELDQQELATLMRGGSLCLSIIGTQHPPVLLFVTEPVALPGLGKK